MLPPEEYYVLCYTFLIKKSLKVLSYVCLVNMKEQFFPAYHRHSRSNNVAGQNPTTTATPSNENTTTSNAPTNNASENNAIPNNVGGNDVSFFNYFLKTCLQDCPMTNI